MRHASTKEIYAYWDRLRGLRRAPDRHELSPAGFGRHLPDLFLLERDAEGEFRFRIAGSRLCSLFGRELRGKSIYDVISHASADDARDMLAPATDDVLPVVAGISALLPGHESIEAELLLLPLLFKENTDQRLLGSFSPKILDRGLAKTCVGLEIITFRVLSDVEVQFFHAPLPEPPPRTQSERRARFRIVEGGRT